MAPDVENMVKLVASGGYGKVEEEWAAAIEDPKTDLPGLLPVLEALVQAEQTESAELLAWSALSPARERLDPPDCLELARSMYVAVPDSKELRGELIQQYKMVYADHPDIDGLIRASGLGDGSKKPRLALRTLELCLFAERGSFLLSRQDESVAEVVAVSANCTSYTVKFDGHNREYQAAELAREFAPADPDDFRVLSRCRPDRLQELIDKDPKSLAVSILKARGGSLSADDLRFTLCPRYLPQDKWSKWWTKARAALKKDQTVRLEGRSPVMLVYDPTGWTIEEISWENFPKSEAAADYYDAVESYFREAKARKLEVRIEHLNRMAEAIRARNAGSARQADDRGLGMTLVLEKLMKRGATLNGEVPRSSSRLLAEADNPVETLAKLSDGRLWPAALEATREGCPDRWPEIFSELLPLAPLPACELIAERLPQAERAERLTRCLERMMDRPAECLEAIAWVWKGSEHLAGVALPDRLELLTAMLHTLADLQRDDRADAGQLKCARAAVKNALGTARYRGFKECLDSIEEGMASALRNRIRRLDGLGVVLVENLIEEIRKRFPGLWAQRQEEAWKETSAIYCTEQGLKKLEDDIDQVVNVEMSANAKAIGEAAARGDLSENSEYRFALEARDMLRARLAKLQEQRSLASLIDPDRIPTDRVGIGSRVFLSSASDATRRTLTFLGPWEARIEQGIYNYQAPLSQQLMGRSVGETVSLALGDTETRWTIERIERAL